MQHPRNTPGSAGYHFDRSPEYFAREVTKDWGRDHPEWTDEQVLFTYEFLRDIYRQERAWWEQNPRASDRQFQAIHAEIVRAYLRGERFVQLPGKTAMPITGDALRARHNALWNCSSPEEKARFAYRDWLRLERAQGRRPKAAAKRAMFEQLLRHHQRHPRTPNPIPSYVLGHH